GEYIQAGSDFVGIMTNGTSGDINIWDFEGKKDYPTAHFEKGRQIGEDIARKLAADLDNRSTWSRDVHLEVQSKTLTCGVRKPDASDLAEARKIVDQSDYENFVYSDEGLRKVYAREQLLLDDTP